MKYILNRKQNVGNWNRGSVTQPLPTGSICGAHSQGLAYTSAFASANFRD